MQKKRSFDWPEIVLSTSDSRTSQAIRRAVKAGQLRKIATRLYTSNMTDTPEEIIKKNRYFLLSALFPKAVISHRSALEGGVSSEGAVFLTYKYTKTVQLPGLSIRLIKGPGPDLEDTPFLDEMYIASQGRAFLENMQKSRQKTKEIKTLSASEIESRLERLIRVLGNEEVNNLRDQAKRVASRLKMQDEFAIFDKLLGAMMGTRSDELLQTAAGKSRVKGIPYDTARIDLFATLSVYLLQKELPRTVARTTTKQAKTNLSFFEAYFSNYIEGTEFAIEEAEKIVFENKIFPDRPEDSHDILETYRLVSDYQGMQRVPQSDEEFLSLLLDRHAVLMQAREDKHPGQFKNIVNRAGNTVFVKPDEVRGTLCKGFEFYQKLKPGIARAIFIKFLISEVHPFIDGNGRIARIFMNAELDTCNLCRIIIPTVYREDYLLALRKLSRNQDPDPYTRMLVTAQNFTNSISFESYSQALIQLQASNAFLEPTEGKLRIIPS